MYGILWGISYDKCNASLNRGFSYIDIRYIEVELHNDTA